MSEQATAGPPASVDVQDPLPEATWFWRRIYVFTVTTSLIVGVALFANNIASSATATQIQAFLSLARWTLLVLWLVITYYLIAPSAEHVTRMWQTAAVLKSGVGFSQTKHASSPDGGTASAQSEAGVGVGAGNAPAASEGPKIANGSPGGTSAYTGPPDEDVPLADPSLPEDASWPR